MEAKTPVMRIYANQKFLEEEASQYGDIPPDIAATLIALDKAKENTRAETLEDVLLKAIEVEKRACEGCAGEDLEVLEMWLARGIRLDLEHLLEK